MSKPSKRKQKPLFIDWCSKDALDGMIQLDIYEELAYRRVLDLIIVTNNLLEDNDRRLAQMTKVGPARWRAIKPRLLELEKLYVISVDGKQYVRNDRMDREIAAAQARIAKASEAGNASAVQRREAAKLLEEQATGATSVASQVPTPAATQASTRTQLGGQPTIHPSTHAEEEGSKDRRFEEISQLDLSTSANGDPAAPAPGGAARPKRRQQIPPEWKLSEKGIDHATRSGLGHTAIIAEAARFHDYHRSRGTLLADIDAAWRTWVGNHLKFEAERAMRSAGGRQPVGYRPGPASIVSIAAELAHGPAPDIEPSGEPFRLVGGANG